jgi:YHS domain-containing protein
MFPMHLTDDASNEKETIMAQTFTDPVCGMQVQADTAAGHSNYNGKTYYFCSKADKDAFDRNPEKYVKDMNKEKEPMRR